VACGLSYSAFNSSSKVNAQSNAAWSCSAALRQMTGSGIPDHAVTNGNFATAMSVQNLSINFATVPTYTGTPVALASDVGYVLNSVKLDPATAGSCTNAATSTANGAGCVLVAGQDPWRIEALGGAFVFGVDSNNAHVQPNGQYHYHGVPEGYLTLKNKGVAMTLIGFAKDGFPIYARYGYTSADSSTSLIKIVSSSYVKKLVADSGRPSVAIFPMGTFTQDYVYTAGAGDLDQCNGRKGVTPEFPNGIYHYFVTDTFPYIQRCVNGAI
jgi:hypothetical protein